MEAYWFEKGRIFLGTKESEYLGHISGIWAVLFCWGFASVIPLSSLNDGNFGSGLNDLCL